MDRYRTMTRIVHHAMSTSQKTNDKSSRQKFRNMAMANTNRSNFLQELFYNAIDVYKLAQVASFPFY